MALVQQLMPLQTQSSLILIPELLLLIQSPVQGPDGVISAASKVHELLTKIHDTLDSALSKWVGNTAHISAYHSLSASSYH